MAWSAWPSVWRRISGSTLASRPTEALAAPKAWTATPESAHVRSGKRYAAAQPSTATGSHDTAPRPYRVRAWRARRRAGDTRPGRASRARAPSRARSSGRRSVRARAQPRAQHRGCAGLDAERQGHRGVDVERKYAGQWLDHAEAAEAAQADPSRTGHLRRGRRSSRIRTAANPPPDISDHGQLTAVPAGSQDYSGAAWRPGRSHAWATVTSGCLDLGWL